MKGIFYLEWTWQPLIVNCTVEYETRVINGGKPRLESTILTERHVDIFRVRNPNDVIHFEIQAACNNVRSDRVTVNTHLAPGNEKTSVRNVSCIWYYPEYMDCTWQPGEETPPNITYNLLYWVNDKTMNDRRLRFPEFSYLLDTGNMCQLYYTKYVTTFGCKFSLTKSISDMSRLVIVITDKSKTIKPYIFHTDVNNIAKLSRPVIKQMYRTPNQHLHVSWNASVTRNVVYEVLWKMSSSEREESIQNIENEYVNIPNIFPDVTYTVKVRVKLSKYKLHDSFLWSEWSEEKTLPGKDNETIISMIFVVLIPCIIIFVAIILLIYRTRLKILIFPRIPDPGKIFSPDLQQEIKDGRVHLYSRPQKEEICPVFLADK
ncbi:interleukin-13 receptor subunit alpha-1 isoform X2 [Dendropsophus ebraccatus]